MRGARERFGDRFVFAGRTPAPDRFSRENRERDPDEGKGDEMRSGERFVKKKNAEEKTDAGRQVLEKAERREPKMTRGVTEPNQRQTGHDPGADEKQNHQPIGGIERGVAGPLQIDQITGSDGSEQGRFEKQTGNWADAGFFPEQSIKSERHANREREPGKPAVTKGEIEHSREREKDRDELQSGELFPEKSGAEKDAHERRHEVTETCFENASGVHRPDKTKPVYGNGQAARETIQERPARSDGVANLRPTLLPAEQSNEETGRPDETMRENFRRGNRDEQFPITRNDSPRAESGDAGDEPGPVLLRRRVIWRRRHFKRENVAALVSSASPI